MRFVYNRWDFNYSNLGSAKDVARALGKKYRDRMPIHGIEISTNTIQWQCNQAIIDAEITYCASINMGGWQFLYYDPLVEDSPNQALNFYHSSSIKNLMPYCMMRSPGHFGSTGNYSTQVAAIVAECLQSNYLKTTDSRPVITVYYLTAELSSNWGGSNANFKDALDAIRSGVISGGGQNPYIVLSQGGGTSAAATKTALGCDAITDYITRVPSTLNAPFSTLDAAVQAYWTEFAATGSAIVPICQIGWNRSPRIEKPQPWERNSQKPHIGSSRIFAEPTGLEIAAQLQACKDFKTANPSACETDLAFVYNLTEFDEGGWLLPTKGDPTGARGLACASVMAH